MPTELYIGYPDIPFNSDAVTVGSPFAAVGYESANLATGPRSKRFELVSETTSNVTIRWDLPSGQTADYFAIMRANMLQRYGTTQVDLVANSSTTFGGAPVIYTNASFASASLVGPRNEDFITTFATSASYRYWWTAYYSGGAATKFPHSKVYFGMKFDFGRSPIWGRKFERKVLEVGNREPRYNYSFTWQDIRNDKIQSFISLIGDYMDVNPVILFTNSYHDILKNDRVVHCIVTNYDVIPSAVDSNEITIDFEELI